MMKAFQKSDVGLLHYFLGLEIRQGDGVFLCQIKYAKDSLKKHNMLGCKGEVTLMNINDKLQLEDGTREAGVQKF